VDSDRRTARTPIEQKDDWPIRGILEVAADIRGRKQARARVAGSVVDDEFLYACDIADFVARNLGNVLRHEATLRRLRKRTGCQEAECTEKKHTDSLHVGPYSGYRADHVGCIADV
jgi:hypothetical protein